MSKSGRCLFLVISLGLLAFGCSGKKTALNLEDPDWPSARTKRIVFPNGLMTGAASQRQATELAKILVESHNMAVAQRRRMSESVSANRQQLQELDQAHRRNRDSAQRAFRLLQDMATRQGTGEITVFFPVNSSTISEGTPAYRRLVRFLDYLARKSAGRKIVFTSVGSASTFGPEENNERLAQARAAAPLDIIDRYLVKIPHTFYRVYGVGDRYSPRQVEKSIHESYQHVHLLAVFEQERMKQPAAVHNAKPGPGVPRAEEDDVAAEFRHESGLNSSTSVGLIRAKAPGRVYRNTLGMEFAFIPSGTFTMGSPTGELRRDENEFQHQVTLTKGFYLQTTEVTQGQWKAVMGENPSHFENCGWDCPVENVSWKDVQRFIVKLNTMEGTKKYRLPTEAEWEYACRAGTTGPFSDGKNGTAELGYGRILDDAAWYYPNSERGTHQVAQKAPNPWGLFDMHGNVWEWCLDWEGKYPFQHVIDPTGPETGQARIRRGGSWSHYPMFCRSAFRSWFNPHDSTADMGVRLVSEAAEPREDNDAGSDRNGGVPPQEGRVPVLSPGEKAGGPLETENCLILRDITFAFDSANIRDLMRPILDKAVEIIRDQKGRVTLEGHTCNIGSEVYNQRLSEKRAESIRLYFQRHDIETSRMNVVGYGEIRPKYDNASEAGRRLNRRVEIRY